MLPEATERLVGEIGGHGQEQTAGDETAQGGVEVDQGAEGLDGHDAAGEGVMACRSSEERLTESVVSSARIPQGLRGRAAARRAQQTGTGSILARGSG